MVPLTIHVTLANGTLLVRQGKFSKMLHRLIVGLPRRKWTGDAWEVPLSDLELVRRTFAGVDYQEAPEVGNTVPRLQNLRELPASAPVRTTIATVITDYKFKTPPFAHQRIGFDMMRKSRAFALLMEMGTGKTKTAIDGVSYRIQTGHLDGALILCPKAVLYNWEREIETHSPLEPHRRRTVVLTGSGAEKLAALKRGANTCSFFITNYETLLKLEEELEDLLARKRLAIICDESTEIKNPKAKTTKAATKLGLRAAARYILTGSPITNSPLDAFAQFRFLDPNILGHKNFTSFKAEYALVAKRGKIPFPMIIGYQNLDRLAKRIQPFSYRVLKQDCLDLPPKVFKTVDLEMGTKQRELYKRMRDEAILELEGQVLAAPVVLTKLLRLSQITSGFLPIHDEFGELLQVKAIEDAPKVAACGELVDEALEGGHKVIIWCRFLWEIDQLRERFKDNAVVYHGAVSAEDRQEAVDHFQTDADTTVFIGQIQTGGIGITLTAARRVIYFSNSYSLAERLQSEDRAHRIGQTGSVEYVDLVCKGTVDKQVLSALRDKKSLADLITGDAARGAQQLMDILRAED